MGSESWSVDRSPTNGRVGLQLVESEGPAGPALVGASGDWQMRIPAGWRDCRAKHLAALRRTVATAAIEVAAGEAPDVVWADEVLLCGLPAMLAARHVGAKLVLRLTREEAGAGLFDEDFLPILDSCLQAAAIVLVPDEASAVVVTRYCAGKTRVLVAPPRPDAVRQMVASELSKYHSSHGIPWQRESTE